MEKRNEAHNSNCSCNDAKVCRCKHKGGSGCLKESCRCQPQKDNKKK